jgi:hypothetical protein
MPLGYNALIEHRQPGPLAPGFLLLFCSVRLLGGDAIGFFLRNCFVILFIIVGFCFHALFYFFAICFLTLTTALEGDVFFTLPQVIFSPEEE